MTWTLRKKFLAVQANVNPTLPPKEWPLDALADKMKQYCYLLDDLTPELLQQQAKGDYEALRDYLRQRGIDAYWQKARSLAACMEWLPLQACSMQAPDGGMRMCCTGYMGTQLHMCKRTVFPGRSDTLSWGSL